MIVFGMKTAVLATLFVCVVVWAEGSLVPSGALRDKVGIKFLVTVNDTWKENGCIDTVASPLLTAGVKYNQSNGFAVGQCDHGPLQFNVTIFTGKQALLQVDLTFFSSVIEDAEPPMCTILWNGTYMIPTSQNPRESLLPGCFVQDSREGWFLTYYWFHIYDWKFY